MNTCSCDCRAKGTKAAVLSLVSRILLAIVFLVAGFGKITNFAGTVGYVTAGGFPMPELFTVLAIIFEFGGAILLITGFHARVAAWMLIVFTAIATVAYHNNFGDQAQMLMFMKNLAIIGGLMQVAMYGAGAWALKWNCGMKMCPDCSEGNCGCCGHCECDSCDKHGNVKTVK